MSLEEVAQKARVSVATVSRVLNNVDAVKTSTRARVMRAAAELNYQPNLHARSLAMGSSRTLGIIVSNMENPFFLDIFRSLEADAHAAGYEVLVANTGYSAAQLVANVQLMMGRRVAGLAVIVSEMDAGLIQNITGGRIPVVFYDVGTPGPDITNIRINYAKGTEQIVRYLQSLGHTRMAFIGHHGSLEPIHQRREAFLRAVERHSPRADVWTTANVDGLEGGRDAARELLASGFQPTAIVCVNDFMAVGVLRQLREHGLNVPGDVSVTGFDNIQLSEYCCPALTTAHIPRDRIGHLAFQSLVPNPDMPPMAGREITIDPELIVRESSGAAAKDTGLTSRAPHASL